VQRRLRGCREPRRRHLPRLGVEPGGAAAGGPLRAQERHHQGPRRRRGPRSRDRSGRPGDGRPAGLVRGLAAAAAAARLPEPAAVLQLHPVHGRGAGRPLVSRRREHARSPPRLLRVGGDAGAAVRQARRVGPPSSFPTATPGASTRRPESAWTSS
jgi:hypothetical protein